MGLSAMGQKQTNHRGQKSTFVRFGPKADKRVQVAFKIYGAALGKRLERNIFRPFEHMILVGFVTRCFTFGFYVNGNFEQVFAPVAYL
jgi:hypothetical protein